MNQPFKPPATRDAIKARFTTAEFVRMIELGAFGDMKVELVRGELERMPLPMSSHASWQATMIAELATAVGRKLVMGEVGIDLGEDTMLGPDVVVLNEPIADNRMLLPHEVLLAVEVSLSTIDRDLGMKRAEYARGGIAHYWVVDPERQTVHNYAVPVAGEFTQVRSYRFGEPIPVPGTDRTTTID